MLSLRTSLLLLPLVSLACMRTTETHTPLAPLERPVSLRAADGAPAVHAAFRQEGRVVVGVVAWEANCRSALSRTERNLRVVQRKPDHVAGVMAGMVGVGAGSGGVALLGNVDHFSDEQHCDIDEDGNEQCWSPRGNAALGGVLLSAGAIALVSACVATFAANESTDAEKELGPPLPPVILERDVACGSGAVEGLGLSLFRGDERVAASTTDARGEIWFAVPPWLTGQLQVVADSALGNDGLVTRGEVVGTVNIVRAE